MNDHTKRDELLSPDVAPVQRVTGRLSTLALVGLCLALVSFASLFEFRLLLFSTIGTMLTNITARFRDIIASLVCVKLPTTVYAMNNVLFHGMSNSLLFFGRADL